jgi:hypothetical protein
LKTNLQAEAVSAESEDIEGFSETAMTVEECVEKVTNYLSTKSVVDKNSVVEDDKSIGKYHITSWLKLSLQAREKYSDLQRYQDIEKTVI